jgi:hypothetical protein
MKMRKEKLVLYILSSLFHVKTRIFGLVIDLDNYMSILYFELFVFITENKIQEQNF